jgi:hypothetical protein
LTWIMVAGRPEAHDRCTRNEDTAMNLFQKLDHHAGLVNRMAETVGADLGAALITGKLSGEGLRAAVVNCCACEGAADCPDWLADHAQGAAEAPCYCRNRDLLAGPKG